VHNGLPGVRFYLENLKAYVCIGLLNWAGPQINWINSGPFPFPLEGFEVEEWTWGKVDIIACAAAAYLLRSCLMPEGITPSLFWERRGWKLSENKRSPHPASQPP